MQFKTSENFTDFKLLDSGRGYRLEQWGKFRLARPDPQAIWKRHMPEDQWRCADAVFGTKWQTTKVVEKPWVVKYNLPLGRGESKTGDWTLQLWARLTAFKHTGIFAEQATNWDWLSKQVQQAQTRRHSELKILNLFGYTGAATALLAKLGCFVTHVDASKPAIGWAKENHSLNELSTDSVRWILDDAAKFVKREVKRGAQYDGIVMDPPAFGHSPTGKTWKFGEDLPKLLEDVAALLSQDGKFLLINAYATNSSPLALGNTLEDILMSPTPPTAIRALGGTMEAGEVCLAQEDGRLVSTGIAARWSR